MSTMSFLMLATSTLTSTLYFNRTAREHGTTRGNALYQVDSLFNPSRVSSALLKAHELPPPNTGGNTGLADTPASFDELSPVLKVELIEKENVGSYLPYSSHMRAAREYFKDTDVNNCLMHKHGPVQKHELSGRVTLYISVQLYHIVDVPLEKPRELVVKLIAHPIQDKYTLCVSWKEAGDLIV